LFVLAEAVEDNTSTGFGDTDEDTMSASEDGDNSSRRRSRQGSISLLTKSITQLR
jgi:hypothetical protein